MQPRTIVNTHTAPSGHVACPRPPPHTPAAATGTGQLGPLLPPGRKTQGPVTGESCGASPLPLNTRDVSTYLASTNRAVKVPNGFKVLLIIQAEGQVQGRKVLPRAVGHQSNWGLRGQSGAAATPD